ncbi:Pycsar system effector family protein [Fulvivirga sediminis]|uniref:HD domain-containing protein n=1 Tax=Fulvivirga sediminis TaxID=2803949 RepID=A0A937JZN4_9BACT|nr:Pycsar system effector family protein [Fulvivirga sediminis]MBL3655465.1 HD domain-containing protein [Fulvivirga sediminis]
MTEEETPIQEKSEILIKVEQYIKQLFKEELSDQLLYHSLSHTTEVVEASVSLGFDTGLSDEDQEILELAAWFHDAGYIKKYNGHEAESVEFAKEFLSKEGYPKEKLEKVNSLILSTVLGHQSENLLEELLHDADMSHMGRKRFFRKGELLRVELENYLDKTYTELEWEEHQYNFLVSNSFITAAARSSYERRRVKNIKKQRKNILKARKVTVRTNTGKDFGRGIDTLYRANYRNHINLSAIADGKANMMISINTIMISVIVTLSGASLSLSKGFAVESLRFTIPILILLVGALVSVVFAVLSARPKVTEKDVDLEKVKTDKISLLYFGNFLGVPKEEFVQYLNNLKKDQKRLYDSMSVDIYHLGIVLKEKYRLLSISYNIFVAGLSLTVVAFIVIFFYTNG